MAKTSDMREALLEAADGRPPDPSPQAGGAGVGDGRPPDPSPQAGGAGDGRRRRPGRDGKVNVTGYFDPVVKRMLRVTAAEEDSTIQDLLAEALNDLFAKRGKPEVAPRPKRGRAAVVSLVEAGAGVSRGSGARRRETRKAAVPGGSSGKTRS